MKRLVGQKQQASAKHRGQEPASPQAMQPQKQEQAERLSMAEAKLNTLLESMERLRLADYVRYLDDRRRLFWSNFWSGIARGVGMAIGFTILGAILVLILQDLARHNLPLIGELLDEIVNVVQNRMK